MLEILFDHLILRIFRRQPLWKISSFFLSPSVIFHVSQPWTKELKSLMLVLIDNMDEFQIFQSLQNCELALKIMFLISSLCIQLFQFFPIYFNLFSVVVVVVKSHDLTLLTINL